mmetsp:Transcript_12629/g.18789  ORF Transcript_12629/g.18789 Transcript_12629/m.18789 type:complete len:90 (-) Transcript_12629:173-442(-)
MYHLFYWSQPLSFCGSAATEATATTTRTSFTAPTTVTRRRKDTTTNDTSSASHHVELQKQTAIDTTDDQTNATKYPDALTTDTCVSPKT